MNARFGYLAASGTGLTTLVAFGVALATPPLSGPLCRKACVAYPYQDIAERFPRDYYWMFPAMLATLLYVAFMVALHVRAPPAQRPVAQLGLILAAMAAIVLVGDYYVQLAVVQPSVLAGEPDGIALLSQYNSHGAFIALEELGYLLMSLSLVCMTPSLSSSTRLERVAGRVFLAGFVVTVSVLCWVLSSYGNAREYRFEIAVISIDWTALIVGAFVMAVVFRRELAAARMG